MQRKSIEIRLETEAYVDESTILDNIREAMCAIMHDVFSNATPRAKWIISINGEDKEIAALNPVLE
jgi:hypothetical protein